MKKSFLPFLIRSFSNMIYLINIWCEQLSVIAHHVTIFFSSLNSSCRVRMHTFPIYKTRNMKTNIKLDLRNLFWEIFFTKFSLSYIVVKFYQIISHSVNIALQSHCSLFSVPFLFKCYIITTFLKPEIQAHLTHTFQWMILLPSSKK